MKLKTIAIISVFLFSGFGSFSQRLVLPGDYPDPSVVKIGDTYWASATTSNWFPAYPLLKSKDLVNWQQHGYVFDKMPEWADYYFWAPEISYENGRVYIYYSAHKKNGNLCLGVASADRPEGPYKDHGALMCQEAGSIDAFPIRDENGKLYMIWKEDGNSVKKPTPIWIMEMNEQRTALMGEKKELFRNELSWEGNLVEGVSIIKNGEYYYAFYAARGCCGVGCNYVVGVARSKKLFGPWEKFEKGPAMDNMDPWICPGHGTPIEKDGRYYFLYHAYNKSSHPFTGREGVLSEFVFNKEGWIEFVKNENNQPQPTANVLDRFNGKLLSDRWQWSVFQPVTTEVKSGELHLQALPSPTGAYIGTKIFTSNYSATTVVCADKSSASAGLALVGDDKNAISVLFKHDKLEVIRLQDGKETKPASINISPGKKLHLKLEVINNSAIRFMYSLDQKNYSVINDQPLDGAFLPPWDRAVRVGLLSKGAAGEKAVFDEFQLNGEQ